MTSTGWDNLQKAELIIEARVRGLTVDETWSVLTLLSTLKDSQLPEPNYQLHVPQVTSMAQEILNFQVARGILEESFDKVSESFTTNKGRRLLSRVNHWIYRTQSLKEIVDPENKNLILELEKFFLGIKDSVTKMFSEIPTQHPPVNDMAPLDIPPMNDSTALEFSSALNENAIQLAPNVFTPQSVVSPTAQLVTQPVPTVPMPTPVPAFSYEIAKLPNPILGILKQGRRYDVTNYDSILHFLRTLVLLIRQAVILNITDSDILKILYPYCDGLLADFISNIMYTNSTISNFHEQFLKAYLPLTMISRFTTQFVLRPQQLHEAFHQYIQDVRLHAEMFKVNYTEEQLVELIIMNASKSEVRSLFLNNSPPKTFSELSDIASKLNHCESGNLLRSSPSPTTPFWQPHRNLAIQTQPAQTTHRRTPVCFYCEKPGHVIRECRKRIRDRASNSGE